MPCRSQKKRGIEVCFQRINLPSYRGGRASATATSTRKTAFTGDIDKDSKELGKFL